MFSNKHIIAALLITPVLAVLGYVAVDRLVAEKPHAAVAGESYRLVAKSNCRYSSGRCDLANGDVKLTVTLTDAKGQTTIGVSSAVALDGIKVSLGNALNADSVPVELRAVAGDPHQWQAAFAIPFTGQEMLRIVAAAAGSYYYSETGTAFANYSSGFGRDFRR